STITALVVRDPESMPANNIQPSVVMFETEERSYHGIGVMARLRLSHPAGGGRSLTPFFPLGYTNKDDTTRQVDGKYGT
ncbi:MAG: hypothetical protein R3231_03010, partial [bacterium]|nr:hypothetical protein [bacterium]